jgi:pyrroline-5-carboxylate reductase
MLLTLIGNGNMAQALIYGLINDYEIEVVGRDISKLEALQQKIPNINIVEFKNSFNIENKNIILCTKPNSIKDVAKILKGNAQSFFSILAGIKLDTLKENFNSKLYVRAMPNLSAKYLKSTTSLVTTADGNLDLGMKLFQSIGSVIALKSENELDIATAIAGSGPAFLAIIAEALEDAGVVNGLQRKDSKVLVDSLFEGFAPLLSDPENIEKSAIKNAVMSPNGTTSAGVKSMENSGVRSAMIETISQAYRRALELAKN